MKVIINEVNQEGEITSMKGYTKAKDFKEQFRKLLDSLN